MADKDLVAITAATSISATDLLYAVIGGNSRKITVANFFTSPTLITPALGVASATSFAINGATIGTDKLAVTGTASISGQLFAAQQAVGTPAYSFVGATTSGMTYSSSTLNLVHAGAQVMAFQGSAGGIAYLNSGGTLSFAGDAGISRNAAGVIQFGTTAANAAGSWLATSAGLGPTPAISASTMFNISAGTTAISQMRFGASTAPTSPVDGDYWFDGTNVKIRVSGATKTFTLT